MSKTALPLQNVCGTEKKAIKKESLVKLLRWHFGHSDFRGKQLEAIHAVLSGPIPRFYLRVHGLLEFRFRGGRDCFCLMPTGGGKSICYQIPALAKQGIVLVVSPLIALMENQVTALKEKGISAEFLSSSQTLKDKNKIYEDLGSGKPSLRLLYVTPELIATSGFMARLTKIHARGLLNLIAIDEAHCVSTWGHDFRPSYRKLSSLRHHLPGIPVIALTATAVPKVQEDVIASLCLQNPLVLKSSFNRSNIYYEVRYKDLLDDPYSDLCNYIKSYGDICAIVYCLERTTCDDLALHLSQNGISSAGLNGKLRSTILDNWLSSKTQVVVATVAFGLLYYGVDDCRRMQFILGNATKKKSHSSSLEDGSSKKSLADFRQMVEYCEEPGCRRKKILQSFGEEVSSLLCAKSCDACRHPNVVSKYLEELATTTSFRKGSGSSRIYISSASDFNVEERHFSEFWNRDDEASGSEEDISDSDDAVEMAKTAAHSSKTSGRKIQDKIELLQRAEENYYRSKNNTDKQANKVDKNAISGTLRDSGKQRLLNAMKQNQHRFSDLEIDSTSAEKLENDCYKKYEKSGKSFYLSQMASIVRWLSTVSSDELSKRLGNMVGPVTEVVTPGAADYSSPSSSPIVPVVTRVVDEKVSGGIQFAASFSQDTILPPPILSFSEFINSRKASENQPSSSKRQSSDGVRKDLEKKTKYK
ncbi:hypothetical protein RD792_013115 [Penstemon davidsonii]|uniref:ATP-dependent DNA helicase n=1 Tax=Penstemon davidsonii TaxID=160366 RepID=A0ABR0CU23_9LAMI|nr:hypothetical protein RD792_013115 [Penstemon davidsonii]